MLYRVWGEAGPRELLKNCSCPWPGAWSSGGPLFPPKTQGSYADWTFSIGLIGRHIRFPGKITDRIKILVIYIYISVNQGTL